MDKVSLKSSKKEFIKELAFLRQRVVELEELNKHNGRLNDIFSSLKDLIFVLDKDGVFTEFYVPNEELYIPPGKFIGKKHSDVMPPHLNGLFNKAFEKNKDGKVGEYNYALEIAGKKQWYHAKQSPLFAGGQFSGAVAVIRNITQQKQLNRKLEETEDRYHTLIELGAKIGEAVIMLQDIDGKEGAHIYVSDLWPQITGYSREELLNMSFFDLVSSEDKRLSVKRHRQKMAGKAIPDLFELSIIRKDREELPIEITSAATIYKGEPTNVVYIRDITERKKTEKALEESEQRYHTLFENAPVAISETDFSGAKDIFNDLKKQGVKDFKAYFENNPDKIYECYKLPQTTYFNPKYLEINEAKNVDELKHWKQKTLKNRNSNTYYEFWQTCKRSIIDLAEGRTRLLREARIVTVKGNIRTTLEHIIVAPGHEDTLSRVIIYYYDITELKEKTEELIKYQEQLEKLVQKRTSLLELANRELFEEIEQRKLTEEQLISSQNTIREQLQQRIYFTRALVHELKTFLTPLITASEILEQETSGGKLEDISSTIRSATDSLFHRVDEMLDLAKGEVGRLELHRTFIEPKELIMKIVLYAQATVKKNMQTFQQDISYKLPRLWVDEERITQIILNLLNNAFAYTPVNGTIKLRAFANGESFFIEVSDNGPGLTPETVSKIFRSHHKIGDERRVSSLGIGLPLAKILAELHKGHINVESQKGKGSIFTLVLPVDNQLNNKDNGK